MNRGAPPTEPNARTGEFTPPGITLDGPVEELGGTGVTKIGSEAGPAGGSSHGFQCPSSVEIANDRV